jgi:hypothetical protein
VSLLDAHRQPRAISTLAVPAEAQTQVATLLRGALACRANGRFGADRHRPGTDDSPRIRAIASTLIYWCSVDAGSLREGCLRWWSGAVHECPLTPWPCCSVAPASELSGECGGATRPATSMRVARRSGLAEDRRGCPYSRRPGMSTLTLRLAGRPASCDWGVRDARAETRLHFSTVIRSVVRRLVVSERGSLERRGTGLRDCAAA